MSNKLSDIFSSLEQIAPGIEWVAFYLSGYGDEFAGFRELDVCINGETARRGAAKESNSDSPNGTDLENVLNKNRRRQRAVERYRSEPLNIFQRTSLLAAISALLVQRRAAFL